MKTRPDPDLAIAAWLRMRPGRALLSDCSARPAARSNRHISAGSCGRFGGFPT